MVISYSKEFIFIHIDKTAGTSIKNALFKYAWFPHESLYSTLCKRLGLSYYSEEFYDHIRATELRQFLPEKTYSKFFKFAIVRNPWDWMYSSYTFFLKNKDMHPHVYFKNEIQSFKAYILWQTGHPYAFHTQSEFIYDHNDNLIIDYVGKFESLESELKHICDQIGINISLPHLNKSNDDEYSDHYDAECKDLVFNFYKTDVKRFGYEF